MFLIVWSIAPRVPAKCPNLLSASRLIISAAQIITTTASRTIQFDAGLSNQSTQSFQISIMVVPLSSTLRVYIITCRKRTHRDNPGYPCEQRRSRQMIEWLAQSAPRRDRAAILVRRDHGSDLVLEIGKLRARLHPRPPRRGVRGEQTATE